MTTLRREGEELEAKAKAAEEGVTAASDAVKAKLAAVQDASKALAAAKADLQGRQEAQKEQLRVVESAKGNLAVFEKALDVDFAALHAGGIQLQAHFIAMEPVLEKLGLDNSVASKIERNISAPKLGYHWPVYEYHESLYTTLEGAT